MSQPETAPAAPVHPGPPVSRPSLRRIGDVIVELGFANREAVERAVADARDTGRTTGQTLLEQGVVTEDQLARAVAKRYGIDHVDLNTFEIDPAVAKLVEPAVLRRHRAVPIALENGRTLVVATSDPANMLAMDDLAMMTGHSIRRVVATVEDLDALLGRLGRLRDSVHTVEAEQEAPETPTMDLRESAADAPVVKLVHSILADAIQRGASDIHLDPEAGQLRVRFRVDGVVFDAMTVPRSMTPGLISRVKIMADLDIAERRMPQDGRIGLTVDGHSIDIRVATLPIVRGESIVLRILDKGRTLVDLDRLGMENDDVRCFRNAIHQTHGAVLVTGPTGSGKSTTLYGALTEINDPEKTIITIEDPVEYELEGIKQVQVQPKIGLDFKRGLRSMVRSDPDVMMVGEIRDRETAQIAIESALTGHLVLSTLHTNDAPMSVARLIEMGIEPFLVASGVSCVVAQRLARRLCDCKQPVEIGIAVLVGNGFRQTETGIEAFEPGECVRCAKTGYRGRVGLYEVMEVTDELRELIVEKRSAEVIAKAAMDQGMRRLREDAFNKIRAGVTSMSEVLRVLGGTA